MAVEPTIRVGREVLGQYRQAVRREWLVTNGIGGYASGTLADTNSRRYHGVLVSAIHPPATRVVTLAKLDGWAELREQSLALTTNAFSDGTVDPQGEREMEAWWLEGTVPVWRYALAEARLERRIFMRYGHNTTYVVYHYVSGKDPLTLRLRALGTWRDYHGETQAPTWTPEVTTAGNEATFTAEGGAFRLGWSAGAWETTGGWTGDFFWDAEHARGLPDEESLWAMGWLEATLQPGDHLVVAVTTEPTYDLDWRSHLDEVRGREAALLALANFSDEPAWVRHLALAADQFLVGRGRLLGAGEARISPVAPPMDGVSVIAGYHWFTDWGRDTMIALPGLTLATGRLPEAAAILRTFARYVDQGMLPNRFVEADESPEYNTVDATLWYFDAIGRYWQASGDEGLLHDLWPTLEGIVDWHERGTRYGIRLDADGLIAAGEPGVQLTWMDAKVDDWVVTPRQGKAVEINALWYNAMRWMVRFAEVVGASGERYTALAERCAASFERFWYAAGNHLYDVIDTGTGDDPALRPNQIFAVSVSHSPLSEARQVAVVEAVGRTLLTSYGLRSLAPGHPAYIGLFRGDRYARDGAYHQGTTWGWLIGPYADAVARLHGREAARELLLPFRDHLLDSGMGSIAEIFDGDAPHTPHGCVAQAWSVAEVLRAWRGL